MEYRHRIEQRMSIELRQCIAIGNSIKPRLGLAVTARNPFDYSITMLQMEGGLSIQHPQEGLKYIGQMSRICSSDPPYPMNIHTRSDNQELFVVDLDWPILEEVEKLREGGDLVLVGKAQFLCARLSDTTAPSTIGALFWMQAEMTKDQSSQMKVPQREWLSVLRNWGYADKRILEITVPAIADKEGFEQALVQLHVADQKLWQGHYDDVLVACRKSIELLQPLTAAYIATLDATDGHVIRKPKFDGFQKAIKGLYDVGAHPGATATRAEAVLGLAVLKEFMAYLCKQDSCKVNSL